MSGGRSGPPCGQLDWPDAAATFSGQAASREPSTTRLDWQPSATKTSGVVPPAGTARFAVGSWNAAAMADPTFIPNPEPMSNTPALPRAYENTLIGRCMRAYDEAPAWGAAHPDGIALVLEHLAAEIMAEQHIRGSMDAHEAARMLLEGARRVIPLPVIESRPTSADILQGCPEGHA